MKNIVASIQAKLKNISVQTGKTYQLILIRYFIERLIYRISVSPFKHNFCLKGGALLYAIEKESSRPTLDLDLLAIHIHNKANNLKIIFGEIAQIPYENDGVLFLTDSITTEDIVKDSTYSGIRINLEARLGNIRQNLQIDIGFGDVVTPHPLEMNYPALLQMSAPQIIAYSIETVIAEKFEAMITLGNHNSRMKDFYDVFRLLKAHNFQQGVLKQAIINTFQYRKTVVSVNQIVFSPEFAENPKIIQQWRLFLGKLKKNTTIDAELDFSDVMKMITTHLQPIYNQL